MKISGKLIIAFLAIATLTLFVGIMGITNLARVNVQHQDVFARYGDTQGVIGSANAEYLKSRIYLRDIIMNGGDADKVKTATDKTTAALDALQMRLTEYEKTMVLQEDRDKYGALQAALTDFRQVLDQVMQLALAGKSDEATAMMRSTAATDATAATEKAMNDLVDYNSTMGEQTMAELEAGVTGTTWLLIGIVVVAVILAAALGTIIARSISRPIVSAMRAADALALGDIDVSVKATTTDEVGKLMASLQNVIDNIRTNAANAQAIANGNIDVSIAPKSEKDVLSRSMKQMADTIKSLMAEMQFMAEQHDLGDIDIVVDEQKFQGSYNTVANGVNAMVKGHIAVKKKAMACVAEFSRGNFDAPLEKFPGKKAFINDNIELLRANLKALIVDANLLVDAALEGRLSTRADAGRHNGDFGKIIEGINSTLDAVIEPITEASQVLQKMAGNDLSVTAEGDYRGDHAEIKNAINFTLESLNSVLAEINAAAEQVAAGTQQVSSGSQALSQGATEQASAIEELTASVTEIAEQTRRNAVNAGQANELAQTARDNAVEGNAQMKEMQKAMAGINESSASISKIIKVIDDIAFQTNLLALNAAVEAARAGQYGKGFAVVAEEVRSLAQRSAAAAKETTALIEESIKKVQEGTAMADETAQALQKIVGGVEKATDLVSGIAKASGDQASAVAQVNRGIEQVAQVVQTNSATAEESAAASEELSSQATLLKEMVGRFSLKGQIAQPPQKALPEPREKKAQRAPAKPSITLSSREFGKY